MINTIKNLSDYGSFESYITSLVPRNPTLKLEVLEEIKTFPRTTRGKGRRFGFSKDFPELPVLKGGNLECHLVNSRESNAAKRIAQKTKATSVKKNGAQGKTKVYKCDCCTNLIKFESDKHKSIGWCKFSSQYKISEFPDDDEVSIVSLNLNEEGKKQCFKALKQSRLRGGQTRTTSNKCAVDALNSYFKYHNKPLLDPLTIKHRDETINQQLDSNELVEDTFFSDPEVTQGYSVILFDHKEHQIRFFDHFQNKFIFVGFKNHHYYLENSIPNNYSLVSYNGNIIRELSKVKKSFKQMHKAKVQILSVLAFFNNQLVHISPNNVSDNDITLEVISAAANEDEVLTEEIRNVIPSIDLESSEISVTEESDISITPLESEKSTSTDEPSALS